MGLVRESRLRRGLPSRADYGCGAGRAWSYQDQAHLLDEKGHVSVGHAMFSRRELASLGFEMLNIHPVLDYLVQDGWLAPSLAVWVVSAYMLTFGGLLLTGGRLGDFIPLVATIGFSRASRLRTDVYITSRPKNAGAR